MSHKLPTNRDIPLKWSDKECRKIVQFPVQAAACSFKSVATAKLTRIVPMKTADSSSDLYVYDILVPLLMLLHALRLLPPVGGNAKHSSGLHS